MRGRLRRRNWLGFLSLWALLLPIGPLGCSGCGQPAPQPRAGEAPPGVPVVRVRILQNLTQIKTSGSEGLRIESATGSSPAIAVAPGQSVLVAPGPSGWIVAGERVAGNELWIVPASPAPDGAGAVRVGGQSWRGKVRLAPAGAGRFDAINYVDVESYLAGVLARELRPEFLPEAYAAQAIVARTYALYEARTAPPGRAWDLYPDTRSQVYGGVSAESPRSRDAVARTRGVVVAWGPPGQERIFKAYFSACCGGAGQSAAQAFGDPPIEPLSDQRVGRRCAESPRFNWGPIVISKSELTRRIRLYAAAHNRAERNMAALARIDVARRNESGRPVVFSVTDARGARFTFSGEELRRAANAGAPEPVSRNTLPSSFFTPVARGDEIRFENGHGFGHGVGLCQWCAQAEAEQGIGYEQIVTSAYRGSKLIRAY